MFWAEPTTASRATTAMTAATAFISSRVRAGGFLTCKAVGHTDACRVGLPVSRRAAGGASKPWRGRAGCLAQCVGCAACVLHRLTMAYIMKGNPTDTAPGRTKERLVGLLSLAAGPAVAPVGQPLHHYTPYQVALTREVRYRANQAHDRIEERLQQWA